MGPEWFKVAYFDVCRDAWKEELPMIHRDLGLDVNKLRPGARHWATQSWLDAKVASFLCLAISDRYMCFYLFAITDR